MSAALLVSQDLFFTGKITGTAAALGTKVTVVSSREQLEQRLEPGTRAIFLDLACKGITPQEVRTASAAQAVTLIAFGAHVDVASLEAARTAGFDLVLPRSRFSTTLPDLIRQHILNEPPASENP